MYYQVPPPNEKCKFPLVSQKDASGTDLNENPIQPVQSKLLACSCSSAATTTKSGPVPDTSFLCQPVHS